MSGGIVIGGAAQRLILICDRVRITQGEYAGRVGMVVGRGSVAVGTGQYHQGGIPAYHVQFEQFGLPPDRPSVSTPRWIRADWVEHEER